MSEQEMVARIIDPNAFGSDFGLPDATVSKMLALDKATAILTTLASRTPEGMVMVPREPTHEMLAAAHDGPLMASDYPMDGKQIEWLREMWTAMLAATPTPSGAE